MNITVFSYEDSLNNLILCLDICKRFNYTKNPKLEITFETLDEKQQFENQLELHLNSKSDPSISQARLQAKSLLISEGQDNESEGKAKIDGKKDDSEKAFKSTDGEFSDSEGVLFDEMIKQEPNGDRVSAFSVPSRRKSQNLSPNFSDSQSGIDPQEEDEDKVIEQLNNGFDISLLKDQNIIEKPIQADPIKLRYLLLHHDLQKLIKKHPCHLDLPRKIQRQLCLKGYEDNVKTVEKKILKLSSSLDYVQLNRPVRPFDFLLLIQAEYSRKLKNSNNVFLVSYRCDITNLNELEGNKVYVYIVGKDKNSLDIVKRELENFSPKRIILLRVEKALSEWEDQFDVMMHYLQTVFYKKLQKYVEEKLNPQARLELNQRETRNIKEAYFIISNLIENFANIQSLINLKSQELFLLTFSFETQYSIEKLAPEIEKYKEKILESCKSVIEFKKKGKHKMACMLVGRCQEYNKNLYNRLLETQFFQKTNCRAKLILKVGPGSSGFEENVKKHCLITLKDIQKKKYQSMYEFEGVFEEVAKVANKCCENQCKVIKTSIAHWNSSQEKQKKLASQTKSSVSKGADLTATNEVAHKRDKILDSEVLEDNKEERVNVKPGIEESKGNLEPDREIKSSRAYREILRADSPFKKLTYRQYEYNDVIGLLKNKFKIEEEEVKVHKFSIQSLWKCYDLARAKISEDMKGSAPGEIELAAHCKLQDPNEVEKLCLDKELFNEKIKLRETIIKKDGESDSLVIGDKNYAVFIIFLVFSPIYDEKNKIYLLNESNSAYPMYSVNIPL